MSGLLLTKSNHVSRRSNCASQIIGHMTNDCLEQAPLCQPYRFLV